MLRSCLRAFAYLAASALVHGTPPLLPVADGLVLRLESADGLVVEDGTVRSWQDRSPWQNHVFASGSPALIADATPSDRPAVRFSGSQDGLERRHATHPLVGFPTGNSPRTLFIVARYHGASAWGGVAYGSPTANRLFGLGVRAPGGELALLAHVAANNNLVSSTVGPSAGWLRQTGDLNSGTATLFHNGAVLVQSRINANTVLTGLSIGQSLQQSGSISFDLAAVLLYNRSLTALERAAVEAYLDETYFQAAVNTPPTVTILAPPEESTYLIGAPVTFQATANDAEDGDITSAVTWDSDRDQRIGQGATISTNLLTIGSHLITASVSDSGGLTGIDSVALVVNGVINTPPQLTILQPADGASFELGALVTLQAQAIDAEEGDLSEAVVWTSSRDGVLGSGLITTTSLSAGSHWVTARVTDNDGALATTTVALTIRPAINAPPSVEILEPADGAAFTTGVVITFSARSLDPEEGNLSDTIVWTSDISGTLGTGATVAAVLPPGTHVVTAAATDSSGAHGSRSIAILVTPAPVNAAPELTIIDPADDSEHSSGTPVAFLASAADAEDDDEILTQAISWSSDRDGTLGAGPSISALLSEGDHLVTATVTDTGGLSASDAVHLRVTPDDELVRQGLVLHLDAAEGVIETEEGVTEWLDLSGRDHHLTAIGHPTLARALTPAGGPAIQLDGLSTALQRLLFNHPPEGIPTGASDRTLFAALRYHHAAAAAGVTYGSGLPNQAFGLVVQQGSGLLALQGFGPGNDLVSTVPGDTSAWLVQSARVMEGLATLYLEETALTSRHHLFDTTSGQLVIGQSLDESAFLGLDVALVLLYDRALTDAEHERVVHYLQSRLRTIVDEDADGLPDAWEEAHFGGLHANPGDDFDGDGLTNEREFQLGLNPTLPDSDGDGMPDGWEISYLLNPYIADSSSDEDGDGVTNLDEHRLGRHPRAGVLPDGAPSLRLHVFQPAN